MSQRINFRDPCIGATDNSLKCTSMTDYPVTVCKMMLAQAVCACVCICLRFDVPSLCLCCIRICDGGGYMCCLLFGSFSQDFRRIFRGSKVTLWLDKEFPRCLLLLEQVQTVDSCQGISSRLPERKIQTVKWLCTHFQNAHVRFYFITFRRSVPSCNSQFTGRNTFPLSSTLSLWLITLRRAGDEGTISYRRQERKEIQIGHFGE